MSNTIHRRHLNYLGDYQVKGPVRNPKYTYAGIQHKDVTKIRERSGCSRTMAVVAATLLNFYRVAQSKYNRLFRATQQWLSVNVLWEGNYDRPTVSRALTLLKDLGLLYCRKIAGYTNEYIHGFIGWEGERSEKQDRGLVPEEQLVDSDQMLQSDEELQQTLNRSNPANSMTVQIPQTNVQIPQTFVQSTHSSIYTKTFQTPSQPVGREGFENLELGQNSQEGGVQQFVLIENMGMDPDPGFEKGFSKEYKDRGSGKSSAPPVSVSAVNQINPVLAVNHQPPVFTPEQQRRYEDREFLLSVAKAWIREERSVISRAETEAAQISVVKSHFSNKPWKIDIEWEAYMQGRVSTICSNYMAGAGNLDMVERYLPSIAIEIQSESPAVTQPMLQVMEQVLDRHQLAEQQQQQCLPAPADLPIEFDETLSSSTNDVVCDANDVLCSETILDSYSTSNVGRDSNHVVDSEIMPNLDSTNNVGRDSNHVVDSEVTSDLDLNNAPPIAALQKMYNSSIGRGLVANQIANNPEWGYVICDGQVVEQGQLAVPQVEQKVKQNQVAVPQVEQKVEQNQAVTPKMEDKVEQKVEQNQAAVSEVEQSLATVLEATPKLMAWEAI